MRALLAVLVVAWGVATSAAPQGGVHDAYVDAILDALNEKGLLTDAEVAAIRRRAQAAAEKAPAAAAATAGVAAPGDAGDRATQRARPPGEARGDATPRPVAQTHKGAATRARPHAPDAEPEPLRVWGRLHLRYTRVPESGGLDGTSSFTFRRARIGFRGPLGDDFYAYTQYEAANETPALANADALLDAWIRYHGLADRLGDITVGQQFIPAYARAPHYTASVERKLPEFLAPGSAGRARGITLERGRLGAPETFTDGLLGDRLQFGVGIFNGPTLDTNNDNDLMLYSAVLALTPLGMPLEDEYELRDLPLRYLIGAGYAWSLDTGTVDARVQRARLGQPVKLDNAWTQAFAEFHAHHWYGWASWTRFTSDRRHGLLSRADGALVGQLDSQAWAIGLSRTFPLPWGHWLGIAAQHQGVDNEHPSRTAFMRILTGRSADEVARGMNRGRVWQIVLTYLVTPKIRWLNEYAWFDAAGGVDYGGLVSQLQVDF